MAKLKIELNEEGGYSIESDMPLIAVVGALELIKHMEITKVKEQEVESTEVEFEESESTDEQ